MRDAFGVVIFAVVGLAALVAVLTLIGRSRLYERIGRGGLSLDEPRGEPRAAAAAIRDEEIRQMLAARSARRERLGSAPLDVEAELARLTAPAADPGLEAEVRAIVDARNARRARAGRPPLDVEAEVARTMRDLAPGPGGG